MNGVAAVQSAGQEPAFAMAAAITVVVVTFDSEEVIGDCLAGIPRGCLIHVVDNASADRTCSCVEACGRAVRLSRMSENLGFARACNYALLEVETPYALLLNPDAAITAEGLERLLAAITATPDLAILAPVLSPEPGASRS